MDLSHTDFFVSVHSFSHIGLALVAWNNYFLKGTGMDNEMDVMRIFLVGGFKYFFMFAPYLGKWSQFDEHFFQWGLKPPTSDVMRIFALLLHRISRKHPGLDSVFFLRNLACCWTDQKSHQLTAEKRRVLQLHFSVSAFLVRLSLPFETDIPQQNCQEQLKNRWRRWSL